MNWLLYHRSATIWRIHGCPGPAAQPGTVGKIRHLRILRPRKEEEEVRGTNTFSWSAALCVDFCFDVVEAGAVKKEPGFSY